MDNIRNDGELTTVKESLIEQGSSHLPSFYPRLESVTKERKLSRAEDFNITESSEEESEGNATEGDIEPKAEGQEEHNQNEVEYKSMSLS